MVFRRKLSLRERGRPRYPDKPLLNALILIPFGVASENELARKLAEFKPGRGLRLCRNFKKKPISLK